MSRIRVNELIERLNSYNDVMRVKIVYVAPGYRGVHGHVQYNVIDFSDESQTLQFAKDPNKPLYVDDSDLLLGQLLSSIEVLLSEHNNPNEAKEYFVRKHEIGFGIPGEVIEPDQYLTNIETNKTFESSSFQKGSVVDTVYLEFS